MRGKNATVGHPAGRPKRHTSSNLQLPRLCSVFVTLPFHHILAVFSAATCNGRCNACAPADNGGDTTGTRVRVAWQSGCCCRLWCSSPSPPL